MKRILSWFWSALKRIGRGIDSLALADLLLALKANSRIEGRLKQLEDAPLDSWNGDQRASLATETLHQAADRELGYRSEIVSKTHRLVSAAGLVVTLVSAGTVVTVSISDGASDHRMAVLGLLGVAMLYFLTSWRLILDATAPAKVFRYSVEEATREDEAAAVLRAIDSNRQVTNLILNRSAVARSSVWRALLVATIALALAALVAFVGPEAEPEAGRYDRPDDTRMATLHLTRSTYENSRHLQALVVHPDRYRPRALFHLHRSPCPLPGHSVAGAFPVHVAAVSHTLAAAVSELQATPNASVE